MYKKKKSKSFFGKILLFLGIIYPHAEWRFYAESAFIHGIIHIIHRKNRETENGFYGNHKERMFCVEIIKMPKRQKIRENSLTF